MTEFAWKRKELAAKQAAEPVKKRRVIVLYTGGTIGMKWTDRGYQPVRNHLMEKVHTYPMLCEQEHPISDEDREIMAPLTPHTLPLTMSKHRITYCILEYFPLLDSSNMSMKDWARIATDIGKHYESYDAFIVLHGTDTMAYTASALSFMLQNLGKSVILTGSQIPLSELRSDGRDNFLGALLIAGSYIIPEVALYFNNKLYRGNRTTKTNSSAFDAFSSPNMTPLATVGVDIHVDWDSIFRPDTTEKLCVQTNMNPNVGILRLFPGITTASVQSFLQPPMEGVILQTYGAGNAPDSRTDLISELKGVCDRGVIIVNCSQCASGFVTDEYAAGRVLREAGVIPGHDMTTEAALTKLSFLLGQTELTCEERKKMVVQNLRGEMTVLDLNRSTQFSIRDTKILTLVAQTMRVTSAKEARVLQRALLSPLMCAAASRGDTATLRELQEEGGDLNAEDYAGLTPLHLAAVGGHLDTVDYLLKNGSLVHKIDSFGHSPLYAAVKRRHFDVIDLLVKTGAHLHIPSWQVATNICQAAAEDDAEGLRAWHQAGADITNMDYGGRTALTVAQDGKCRKALEFLTTIHPSCQDSGQLSKIRETKDSNVLSTETSSDGPSLLNSSTTTNI